MVLAALRHKRWAVRPERIAYLPWRWNHRNEHSPMTMERAIRESLQRALRPIRLEVTNESELHTGHPGSPGTGESHFRVVVVSELFEGRSRVDRHRMINDALAAHLKCGVHALAIKAYAPGEQGTN
jgi:BolA protein